MKSPSRARALLAATAVASALILIGSPQSALATAPGVNGRIAFMRPDDAGKWQIWTANPDLTSQEQLTKDNPVGGYNGWPSWSPNGQRIAFEAGPDPDGPFHELYTMTADGSAREQITHLGGSSISPSWSPTGEWIAFASDGGGGGSTGIWVVHPDGSAAHQVIAAPTGPRPSWLDAPRFSPDGTRLAYTSFAGGHETHGHAPAGDWRGQTSALWVVNLDGSGAHQVVAPGQAVGDADWSPDGRFLIFEQQGQNPGAAGYNVMRKPVDGGGLVQLTDLTGFIGAGNAFNGPGNQWSLQGSFDPAYSPDGTKILFGAAEVTPTSTFCMGLQVIQADGSDRHWVNGQCTIEHQVDWGTAPLR